jgi:hypothetical protein
LRLQGFGLRVRVVDLDDHPDEDILTHLAACCAFIAEGRAAAYGYHESPALDQSAAMPAAHVGGVLVHCTMGISRSAAICAGYMMVTSHITLVQALDILKRARRWVRPNEGFMRQLRHVEALLFPSPASSHLPTVASSPDAFIAAAAATATNNVSNAFTVAAATAQATHLAEYTRLALSDLVLGGTEADRAARERLECELCLLLRRGVW